MRISCYSLADTAAAAGFSIDANRIDELRDRLTEYCKEAHVTAEEYIPVVAIDADITC